nr:MAG TPA_asm: hypothetical protein [Caudoviricetes sp.]
MPLSTKIFIRSFFYSNRAAFAFDRTSKRTNRETYRMVSSLRLVCRVNRPAVPFAKA